MAKLPVLSGEEVVKVFKRMGWEVSRQKGSHIILTKENHNATLSVPNHSEVAKGTLRSLIARAEITIEDFLSSI